MCAASGTAIDGAKALPKTVGPAGILQLIASDKKATTRRSGGLLEKDEIARGG